MTRCFAEQQKHRMTRGRVCWHWWWERPIPARPGDTCDRTVLAVATLAFRSDVRAVSTGAMARQRTLTQQRSLT